MTKSISLVFLLFIFFGLNAQNVKDSSIMVSATADASQKLITLNWSTTDAGSFQINRKTIESNNWGNVLASLPGTSNSFTDTSVQPGIIYEYRIMKVKANTSIRAISYIASGIEIPLEHYRKNILILVDSTNYFAIDSNKWNQLKDDYYMDGFGVVLKLVSPSFLPPQIKQIISDWRQINPLVNSHCLL